MAINEKIQKGLEQVRDGNQPVAVVAPVLRPPSNIEADLKEMRDHVRIIAELGAKHSAKVAELRADTVLRPTVVQERIIETDRAFAQEIERHFEWVGQLTEWMGNNAALYTRRAALLRATFDKDPSTDATIRMSHQFRLGKLSADGLLQIARLAAANKDAALVALIVDELDDRQRFNQGNARHVARDARLAITELLDLVPTEAEQVAPMLAEIGTLARQAVVASGQGSTVDKIALGLAKREQGGPADDGGVGAA